MFGARSLKRLIHQQIENPLARRILDGEFTGGEAITIDAPGDGFFLRISSTGTGRT
ncbi:MAG: hypothetical protein HUU22_09765 [Phycisphaerae bacterium]|nr:hypothetical protein [Phycisphaerae bacterium]NUQ46308.1 hypothetical protein [Phycisphaerae bacterium]